MTDKRTDCGSVGQDLAEWRSQIEDECVRRKSSGDELAMEALLWVLEHVLPNPEGVKQTESGSVAELERWKRLHQLELGRATKAEGEVFACNLRILDLEARLRELECRSVVHARVEGTFAGAVIDGMFESQEEDGRAYVVLSLASEARVEMVGKADVVICSPRSDPGTTAQESKDQEEDQG